MAFALNGHGLVSVSRSNPISSSFGITLLASRKLTLANLDHGYRFNRARHFIARFSFFFFFLKFAKRAWIDRSIDRRVNRDKQKMSLSACLLVFLLFNRTRKFLQIFVSSFFFLSVEASLIRRRDRYLPTRYGEGGG